ncbi:MAG TPA: PEP-CTERM sorting domain-containing protein [Candidatus Acidoferrales bacterium]|jgi:hypothetical protein|nr:PEP-CTERM sorting domain-containing protein [Candidatus Acidoferrales bacterium]
MSSPQYCLLPVISTLLAGTAFAGAISVNGTCEFGACTPVDTLAEGTSLTDPFSFVYTFANTDEYRATGTLAARNLSNTTGIVRIALTGLTFTYLGNDSGTPSGADSLVIDFLQNFQTPFATGINRSGFEAINGTFGGPLANASSVQGQVFSNGGTAMALLGPFFPPAPFSSGSVTNQLFAFGPITLADFRYTISFGTGSGVGATFNIDNTAPTVPEPSAWLLMAGGVAFLLFRSARPANRSIALNGSAFSFSSFCPSRSRVAASHRSKYFSAVRDSETL